ncbi:asparagine synthetase B, partial [Fischerella thermalis CCMEE 5319]
MCGIFGFISQNGNKLNDLVAACNIIRHRGPDDEGYVVFKDLKDKGTCFWGDDTPDDVIQSDYKYKPTSYIRDFVNDTASIALGHRRLSILDLSPAGHQPMSFFNNRYWIVLNGEIYNYLEIREELAAKGYDFISNTDTEVVLAAYHAWG